MKSLAKVPATVVTGFLGSGKTTLLSELLNQAQGQRIAVIVNEFGELDIDANLLRGCPLDCEDETPQEGIFELANGCICCTVEEEFLPVMQQLLQRVDELDHILIETSGLALPKPLVQAFNWPEIKRHFTVDSVITLVDGEALSQGRFASDEQRVQQQRLNDESLDHDPSLQELLDDQLNTADLVVITKTDLVDEQQIEALQQRLQGKLQPGVGILPLSKGQASLDALFGLNKATEERIDSLHTHHDHHHHHGHEHKHAHDDFDSVVIHAGEVDGDKLMAILQQFNRDQVLYRLKGFVALKDKPMRQVIQGVGPRINQYFDQPWGTSERKTSLVLIGKQLDQGALQAQLRQAEV